jgi:tetratricopeptide (TPR) repeat protein
MRLQRRRLTAAEAMSTCRRVADALRAAHRHGVIHRDLKPHNVIVAPSGDLKLLDFGIAKRMAATTGAAASATAPQLTQPDAVLGTPGYMAPEQVRGQPADFRSDLFALGCIVYECLTGRRPFVGSTTADVLGQVLHVDPPLPSVVAPELGQTYDALCGRLLRKDPDERFQSADEVLGAIHALTPATASSATASRSVITRPWLNIHTRAGRTAVTAAAIVVAAGTLGIWKWQQGSDLPAAPPEPTRWYERGVEALREGAYVSARDSLLEATRLHPGYVQAMSRLAEAYSELDNESSAKAELLKVNAALPNRTRLKDEARLRLDAVQWYVLREHALAIGAYQTLAALSPKDARGWLDVGRAQEAAGQMAAARDSYRKARQLDGSYAAAHLRFGAAQGTPVDEAITAIDEAGRLYRAASSPEGEIEALLRKGVVLSAASRFAAAREVLEDVLRAATDPRFVSQRVRAKFELARVLVSLGTSYGEAEALGRDGVDEASDARLQTLAANGLTDFGTTLTFLRKFSEAEAQFIRAIDIATAQGAVKVEMRARLQQASLRHQSGEPEAALTLAAAPVKFFADGRFVRNEAQGKIIMARAYESLEKYDEASRLTAEVLKAAKAMEDQGLTALSLDSLASQLTRQGRLPEALVFREQLEPVHRSLKDTAFLAFDLTNRAEALILLGRGREAEAPFAEIADGAAARVQAFANRAERVSLLRALLACTERRFAGVEAQANAAGAGSTDSATSLFATVLREHARAESGSSRAAPSLIAGWAQMPTSAVNRRELSYWIGQTLLVRREAALAYSVASAALAEPGTQGNSELGWRLAGVAALAARRRAALTDGASMSARANTAIQQLTAAWQAHADAYFARPDLRALRNALSSGTASAPGG